MICNFSPGDLVLFEQPTQWWGPGDPVLGVTENMHLGFVVETRFVEIPAEFVIVVHRDGESFVVPESLCRRVRSRE